MTRQIGRSFGALVLQHHERGLPLDQKNTGFACRLITRESGPLAHMKADRELNGDLVTGTAFLPAGGERKTAGWSFAWPVIVTDVEIPRCEYTVEAGEPREGSGEADAGKPDIVKDGVTYRWDPATGTWRGGMQPGDAVAPGRGEGGGGAGGAISIAPIRTSALDADPGFQPEGAPWPEWRPPPPKGTVAIALGGTDHTSQQRVVIEGEHNLIAPSYQGPGVMGTLVHDFDPEATLTREAPPGSNKGRAGRLQSAFRVVRPISWQHLDVSEDFNGVAWMLTSTKYDDCKNGSYKGLAGFGLVYARASSAGGGGGTPGGTPASGSGGAVGYSLDQAMSGVGAGGGKVRGGAVGTGAGKTVSGRSSPMPQGPPGGGQQAAGGGGAEDPTNFAVGVVSWEGDGFLNPGHGVHDKHYHGVTRDAEFIAPAHIDTRAFFVDRFDQERDAPLEFDPVEYEEPSHFTMLAPTHLRYDPSSRHTFMGQSIAGLWRWETEVPYLSNRPPPSRPPGDGPPPSTPTPNPPPTSGPPPSEPGAPPGDDGPPTSDNPVVPGGPGQGAPRWPPGPFDGPYEPQPFGGPLPLPSNPEPPPPPEPPPSPWPPGPDAPPPTFRPQPRPVDPGDGGPPIITGSLRVGEWDHASSRSEIETTFPGSTGFASITGRPQHTTGDGYDFRFAGFPASAAREDNKIRPASFRLEAFGTEEAGLWVYETEPGKGRHRGGTTKGGVAFMPPEVDNGDRGESYDPPGVTPSGAAFVMVDGTYLGFGIPDTTPGGERVETGGFRIHNDAGTLTAEERDSSTWEQVFAADQDLFTAPAYDTTGTYKVNGTQVLTSQQAAISNPSGGSTQDAEARTAITEILAAIRTHGIIAT